MACATGHADQMHTRGEDGRVGFFQQSQEFHWSPERVLVCLAYDLANIPLPARKRPGKEKGCQAGKPPLCVLESTYGLCMPLAGTAGRLSHNILQVLWSLQDRKRNPRVPLTRPLRSSVWPQLQPRWYGNVHLLRSLQASTCHQPFLLIQSEALTTRDCIEGVRRLPFSQTAFSLSEKYRQQVRYA